MWRSAVQVCLGLLVGDANPRGGLAQLARAPALQAGGQRFESVILHTAEAVLNICRRRKLFDILKQRKKVKTDGDSVFDMELKFRLNRKIKLSVYYF